MKKKLMLVAAIATMGLGAFLTACEDDVCTCTWVVEGVSVTEDYDLADYPGYTSCKGLENAFDTYDYGYFDEISCR